MLHRDTRDYNSNHQYLNLQEFLLHILLEENRDNYTHQHADGYNYLYSLLKGYEEEIPEDLDIGDLSYNPWYPGGAIAMYQPLYDESVEYEDGTPATIDQMSYDVANFLTWAAEPTMEERKRLGFIVMGFLIIFVILMYLSVSRLFRDVH